jgi:uncharacterized membrane protein YeaQ/YmgE (transglycosylase-associated protein family)
MHILSAVIIGLFVGAVVRLVFPARDPGGIAMTMTLGLAGSAVAGFLGRTLGLYRADQVGYGVAMSFVGAIVVLVVYRLASPRRLAR